MSFFDDDGEETGPRAPTRAPRQAPAQERRPRAGGSSLPLDRHTLMVRRRVAVVVAVVLLALIVIGIDACLKSKKSGELKDYNNAAAELANEFDSSVSKPLFSTLTGAASKASLNVAVQIGGLRNQAHELAERAKGLSVPGDMAGAQRNLVLAYDLRSEALAKIAALIPAALGGQDPQATAKIAGDMEMLLASDVLYSQRVAPLIAQALHGDGVHTTIASSRSLPNLGWLDTTTVGARLSGKASSSSATGFTPGNHGSALKGVSVGTNTLEVEPTLNHIAGGGSPTFTVQVENSGEFPETNVKVDVSVTARGKVFKASHLVEKTEPGKTITVDIPIAGIPLGVGAKIQVNIEGVQGENDLENNKGSYLAILGR